MKMIQNHLRLLLDDVVMRARAQQERIEEYNAYRDAPQAAISADAEEGIVLAQLRADQRAERGMWRKQEAMTNAAKDVETAKARVTSFVLGITTALAGIVAKEHETMF